MAVYNIILTDYLGLVQILGTNQRVISVAQSLAFTQTGDEHEYVQHLSQNFFVSQAVRYTISGRVEQITQTLEFTQKASRTQVGDVYQNFPIAQSLDGDNRLFDVVDTLAFNETLNIVLPVPTYDTLAFTETIHIDLVYMRSLTQALTYQSSVSPFIPRTTFVSVVTPTIEPKMFITVATSAGSITLRTPEFNNTEDYDQTRIQRNTRGGDLIIYRDPMWPDTHQFSLIVPSLKPDEVHQLQNLITLSLGTLITFTDHEGQSWQGIVTSPQLQITQAERGLLRVSFTFMKVDT